MQENFPKKRKKNLPKEKNKGKINYNHFLAAACTLARKTGLVTGIPCR